MRSSRPFRALEAPKDGMSCASPKPLGRFHQPWVPETGDIGAATFVSARDLEIFRRGLASVRDFLVLDDLTLIQTRQTGLFDGRDVNKDISPAAALWLNEPVTFLGIEPLHRCRAPLLVSRVEGLHGLRFIGNPYWTSTSPSGSLWCL
jgi:hypothetical protein